MTNANNNSTDTQLGNIYQQRLTEAVLSSLSALNQALSRPQSAPTPPPAKFPKKRSHKMVRLPEVNPNTPTTPPPFTGRVVSFNKVDAKWKARKGLPKQLSSRQELLVFIRVVFAHLEESAPAYDNMLRARAKKTVYDCVRRHRMGHPNYRDLQFAVVRDLRPVVGEGHWADAKAYVRGYCSRRAIYPSPISVL